MSWVLLEKLTGSQLVKKFPAFYGTRKFITTFTSVPILSRFDPVHAAHIPLPEYPSLYYPPIYAWVFQVVSFPQVSPPKPCIRLSPTCTLYLCRYVGLYLVACSHTCVCVCLCQPHFYALFSVLHIEWNILCTRNSKCADLLLRKQQQRKSNKRDGCALVSLPAS
jgi:hypothetical protein